jgi:hypothetical protein
MRRVVAATSRGAGIAPAAREMLELLQQVAADYKSG